MDTEYAHELQRKYTHTPKQQLTAPRDAEKLLFLV